MRTKNDFCKSLSAFFFFAFLFFFSYERSQLRTIFGCDDDDGKVYLYSHERENKVEPGE